MSEEIPDRKSWIVQGELENGIFQTLTNELPLDKAEMELKWWKNYVHNRKIRLVEQTISSKVVEG